LVLDRLHSGGARFITNSPPPRDASWRSLRRGRRELWTNDPALSVGAALSTFKGIEKRCELADGTFEVLAARPSDPFRRFGPLETAATLAASIALADIAWRLWREREATDALLPLERFADLDARVTFEPERIRVRMPLGMRHSDLYRAQIIDDLPDIPWLDGRAIEFTGG